jgi:hypothetical protein
MNGTARQCANIGVYYNQVKALLNGMPFVYREASHRTWSYAWIQSDFMLNTPTVREIAAIVKSEKVEGTVGKQNSTELFNYWFNDIAVNRCFDRKRFNPVTDWDDEAILNALRAYGKRRARNGEISSAMRQFSLKPDMRGVFVDFGAGDSGDAAYAKKHGLTAYEVDLFPRSKDAPSFVNRIIADIAEHVPLSSESVDGAVCQAVIDLIEPLARFDFYLEAHRLLKLGAPLSIQFQSLAHGWGVNIKDEVTALRRAGFRKVRGFQLGCVVVKE